MKTVVWITILGSLLTALSIAGAPQPSAAPAALAPAECDCSNLEVLQIELRNAIHLQQAFRNKIPELRTMNQPTSGSALKSFAADEARRGLEAIPDYHGPKEVDYYNHGSSLSDPIHPPSTWSKEDLCRMEKSAADTLTSAVNASACAGIGAALEAHEKWHLNFCMRIGFVPYFNMHGADRAQEEVEAYDAQIKVLRDIIEHLSCGYRANGKFGDTVVAGLICDLQKPFTISSNNPFIQSFDFTPSSPTSGTWKFSYKNGVAGGGGGGYIVEGTDTLKTGIMLHGSGTATAPIAATSSGTVRINLSKLESNDCGSK
jgi:hypothetical protein